MAGETGGDREGPSPPGPINFISWMESGGSQGISGGGIDLWGGGGEKPSPCCIAPRDDAHARVPAKLKTPRIWPTIFGSDPNSRTTKYIFKKLISGPNNLTPQASGVRYEWPHQNGPWRWPVHWHCNVWFFFDLTWWHHELCPTVHASQLWWRWHVTWHRLAFKTSYSTFKSSSPLLHHQDINPRPAGGGGGA